MRIFIFLFLILASFSNAQILEHYPKNQVPYIGGYESYYKDFHDMIIEKDLKSCADKSEFYQLNLLINADQSISFIKDHNEKNIAKNKCAYDLAREVAKYQNNWKAATVDGITKPAVATFYIFPDDLFERYHDGYFPAITFPAYGNYENGGIKEFKKGIINRIDVRGFDWNDRFNVMVEFIISKEAKIENIVMIKSSSNIEFDKRITNGILSTKKKWKPATVNGNPVDYKYRLTLNAVTDY
ncbi:MULTISPECIES: energy transducer TonB [unclassified Kaistella]|uniref:energy transducer TonB n=1 Tax=unclassified Kaistella TaxID=2762626 RepID=UPI0027370553|nr:MULTISPECIES: energy transducer TonB [unclassified Kaistella]MDP2452825.1 energy transducer TonB [Kaistella sp. SH11-4b]MDP2455734.1 energy transducer TonB [Kaistella sp. SH40-3]MDP2458638.1 energy transducer TonB [Kaistella sp. SH19-2b]